MLPITHSLDELKQQAKALRRSLENSGRDMSHSQSLETVAHQYGYRDWNTLHASLGNKPATPLRVGQQVSGAYLGKDCSGRLIALRDIGDGQYYRVTIRFDEPVDIIEFESWSAYRHQIDATVDRHGCTAEKTSNGKHQLRLNLG